MAEKQKSIEEILKEIYDSETHIKIEWIWDGGIEVKRNFSLKENDVIGYHRNNPGKAIREAYESLKKTWAKNWKKLENPKNEVYEYIIKNIGHIWNLCVDCEKIFSTCKSNPIFMCNLYEVPPPDNDAVIFCDGFIKRKSIKKETEK